MIQIPGSCVNGSRGPATAAQRMMRGFLQAPGEDKTVGQDEP